MRGLLEIPAATMSRSHIFPHCKRCMIVYEIFNCSVLLYYLLYNGIMSEMVNLVWCRWPNIYLGLWIYYISLQVDSSNSDVM